MDTLKQLQSGELKGAVSLKLSEGLSYFPPEIFELADTLEILDLSGNKLNSLPADFGKLKKLRILFCSDNQFTVLPEVLADCPLLDIVGFKANIIETVPAASLNPNLRWLILTNNRITVLPAQIGNCWRMQKLMLAGNRLNQLPQQLGRCTNLALLRISANRLGQLPPWLLTMPTLSWLAFSGNLFNEVPVVPPITPIDWSSLELKQVLGEGASGVISKATWNCEGDKRDVAVKIFKGAVTSDGLPEDEMNACITAGTHPGLVQIIGRISEHPAGKKGLVMELIPHSYFNLGNPPSFESCTRDVFKPGMSLAAAQVIKIAGTIASAAAQLHSKGIMHADLYAHNILIDNGGNTLFGDFGAACFYDKNDTETANALERLEVSAFGHLLDDLLELCSEAKSDKGLLQLAALQQKCLVAEVLSRPGFNHIKNQLLILEAASRV